MSDADLEKARKRQAQDQLYVLKDPTASTSRIPLFKPDDATPSTSAPPASTDHVLVFEFNDGELKGKGGKVIHKKFA